MSVVSKIGSQAVSTGFVKRFFGLLKETTQRDGFSGHGLAYYESMLETLGDDAEVFVADYQGKSLAAMIVTYFKNTATYYYGASSNEMRHLMAPYLLQWRAMQEAKRRGMKRYDLFGISPSKSHTWAKVTEFKLKFGGQTVQYAPAVEVVFDRVFYWAMRGAKGLGLRG